MGGRQSSQKGEMEDVLKYFEEELQKWNDTIKNLKVTWEREDRSWVPVYLRQQMEETETGWINIKSIIPPGVENGGKIKYPDRNTQIQRCCQDTLGSKEAEIEQLRKNNDILLKNVQSAERQTSEHVKTIENLKASQKQLARNDVDVQPEQTENEQRDPPLPVNQDIRKEGMTDSQSGKDHIVQKLQKKNKQIEERFKVEKLKMIEENQILAAKNDTLQTQVNELQTEKEKLLLRLSKVAGENLTKNNPGIADLSDPNRPTKLGEVYSELYDNEWTDAFEALKDAGHKEERAIETLKLTLEHVMQFCESKAELLIKKSSDAANLLFHDNHKPDSAMKLPSQLTMPHKQAQDVGKVLREKSTMEDMIFQQRWKPIKVPKVGRENVKHSPREAQKGGKSVLEVENELKELRKKMAIDMIPVVQKAYMERNWSAEYIDDLKPFILKCVFIAWMMTVQSPPMALHRYPGQQEINFDKNFYKEYVTSGPLVSYVVWPALLLKENGPVVCKGVAEGKRTITT